MSVPTEDVQKRIAHEVEQNPIMLYVKGSPQFPQCGFSKAVMDIFNHLGVKYETRDVLSDPELRDGIKRFTNWPTVPQIFIGGKFVGGCDIVRELYSKGELQTMVQALAKPR
jgi:monothiol glutaredoxin